MVSQQWWAGGLAIFSLLLAVGWSWLNKTKLNSQLRQTLEKQWIGHTVQFFYFVGIPYVVVVFGALPPRLLGLKGLEHFALIDLEAGSAVGQMVAAVQYAMVLVFLDWFADVSLTIIAGLTALIVLSSVWIGLTRSGIGGRTGFRVSILSTIYHGFHWAFYRAALWLMTGDFYLGVILGTALVILEWVLIVQVQKNWLPQPQPLLISIIILILTGAIFFYSPNLWLLWPIHLVMVILVKKLDTVRGIDYVIENERFLSPVYFI
jgi:hypothetical protein